MHGHCLGWEAWLQLAGPFIGRLGLISRASIFRTLSYEEKKLLYKTYLKHMMPSMPTHARFKNELFMTSCLCDISKLFFFGRVRSTNTLTSITLLTQDYKWLEITTDLLEASLSSHDAMPGQTCVTLMWAPWTHPNRSVMNLDELVMEELPNRVTQEHIWISDMFNCGASCVPAPPPEAYVNKSEPLGTKPSPT